MKRINGRRKGAAGEREFCKWLKDKMNIEAERNLEQTRSGGSDIIINGFCFEIKRVEVLDKRSWWVQSVIASKELSEQENHEYEPIVAYRQNRKPWNFLISARHIGLAVGYIEIQEREFTRWFKINYKPL